jgi:hypothetical protein
MFDPRGMGSETNEGAFGHCVLISTKALSITSEVTAKFFTNE